MATLPQTYTVPAVHNATSPTIEPHGIEVQHEQVLQCLRKHVFTRLAILPFPFRSLLLTLHFARLCPSPLLPARKSSLHSYIMQSLNITIVGAGIGGLQTALALSCSNHKITVLESASAFEEVGAGIRVPPNSVRLSEAWGVDFSKVKKEISRGDRFMDWKGKVLLDCDYSDVKERYGTEYYFIHRADLINLLAQTLQERRNVTIRLGARVTSYDFEKPSVTLASGEMIVSDLVVCADGIKSAARNAVNGSPITPQDTGDVTYRILVPAASLLADPETRHLVTEPWATQWLGPEGHAVSYPLRGRELYNIILYVTHSSDKGEPVGEDVWKSARNNGELTERFHDWCPQVRKLCAMTGEYLKWRLADFSQLDSWVHASGKVCLLGDACHPMMPSMAQGKNYAEYPVLQIATCQLWLPT